MKFTDAGAARCLTYVKALAHPRRSLSVGHICPPNEAAIIFKHANPAEMPSGMLSRGSLLMVRSSFV